MAAGDRPLLTVIFIDDISHVADKSDPLVFQVAGDPSGIGFEGWIGVIGLSAVMLRVWNDRDTKRALRGRRQFGSEGGLVWEGQ